MKLANDSWTSQCQEYDKWVHLTGSCFITLLLYQILHVWLVFFISIGLSALLALAGSIGLELWQAVEEEYGDGFSWRDLVMDVIGIAFSMWVILG